MTEAAPANPRPEADRKQIMKLLSVTHGPGVSRSFHPDWADPKFGLRVCTGMHTLPSCPISGIRPRPGRIGLNTALVSPMLSVCSKILVLSPLMTLIPMKTAMSPSGSTFLVGYWSSPGPGAIRRFG
jgi:hypothetical protein